jgi:hypothetical protein
MRNTRNAHPWRADRSVAYSAWLSQQPPERQRELIAAERAYLRDANAPTSPEVATAKDFFAALRGVAAVDPDAAT